MEGSVISSDIQRFHNTRLYQSQPQGKPHERGCVADGYIRDTNFLLDIGFQAWCRGFTPRDIVGHWLPASIGEPIRIGDVTIAMAKAQSAAASRVRARIEPPDPTQLFAAPNERAYSVCVA